MTGLVRACSSVVGDEKEDRATDSERTVEYRMYCRQVIPGTRHSRVDE